MTQHYPSNQLEASAWCGKCYRMTRHRVADKRLQFCIPCYEKAELARKDQPVTSPAPAVQQNLFDR